MLITAKAKDKPAKINRWYKVLISKIPKKLRIQSYDISQLMLIIFNRLIIKDNRDIMRRRLRILLILMVKQNYY